MSEFYIREILKYVYVRCTKLSVWKLYCVKRLAKRFSDILCAPKTNIKIINSRTDGTWTPSHPKKNTYTHMTQTLHVTYTRKHKIPHVYMHAFTHTVLHVLK